MDATRWRVHDAIPLTRGRMTHAGGTPTDGGQPTPGLLDRSHDAPCGGPPTPIDWRCDRRTAVASTGSRTRGECRCQRRTFAPCTLETAAKISNTKQLARTADDERKDCRIGHSQAIRTPCPGCSSSTTTGLVPAARGSHRPRVITPLASRVEIATPMPRHLPVAIGLFPQV